MAKLLNTDVPDLPDGYTPLEVVAVVKCLDETGNPTIAVRSSDGIMGWEAVGMLIAASDMARADLQSDLLTDEFRPELDDDTDDQIPQGD